MPYAVFLAGAVWGVGATQRDAIGAMEAECAKAQCAPLDSYAIARCSDALAAGREWHPRAMRELRGVLVTPEEHAAGRIGDAFADAGGPT